MKRLFIIDIIMSIGNDLEEKKLVAFEPNPHHRRAHFVLLIDKGRDAFEAVMELQAPWVNQMSEELDPEDLLTMHRMIAALREKLENSGTDDGA